MRILSVWEGNQSHWRSQMSWTRKVEEGVCTRISDKKPSAVMMLFQRKKANTTPVCMPVKGMCVWRVEPILEAEICNHWPSLLSWRHHSSLVRMNCLWIGSHFLSHPPPLPPHLLPKLPGLRAPKLLVLPCFPHPLSLAVRTLRFGLPCLRFLQQLWI